MPEPGGAMEKRFIWLLLSVASSLASAGEPPVAHTVDVTVDPATSLVTVVDEIRLPVDSGARELTFKLNANLIPEVDSEGVQLTLASADASAADVGMDQESPSSRAPVPLKAWTLRFAGKPPATVKLRYQGTINHPIKQIGEEYARGFSQSPGIVDARGAYLAGSTYWIPSFGDEYVTYRMTVTTPAGWRSVSQGSRVGSEDRDGKHRDTWVVDTPTEEIFVIAAAFTEYEFDAGAVKAMAFLREKDDALANRYLETTAQYLEMYRKLIGPYPYTKFALVENFWETGYGMPSFTLLGSQVIRFPFILHSSYPHELLHNWWGNGVFIDFDSGNWCEGLTAYMADHLVAEQRGQGDEYRRAALQAYTDYVSVGKDFPLSKFRSRDSAASQAVGYGKSTMTWDMLRDMVGDEVFVRGMQRFYRDNKFQRASFDDIRVAFEAVSERKLGGFFDQWVLRTGAPELALGAAAVERTGARHRLTFTLTQQQDGAPYVLQVPIAVYSAGAVRSERVEMTQKSQTFTLDLADAPVRLEVDPQFNLFRTLHHAEIPPSMSKAFGADKVTLVLPGDAPADEAQRYRKLADIWTKDATRDIEVVSDKDLHALPADRSVWILGWNNRWRHVVDKSVAGYQGRIDNDNARLGRADFSRAGNSVVVAVRHPENPRLAAVWLSVPELAAVEGLARKLPHYGKYSYLAFTGNEPANIAKGEWPTVGSPLMKTLSTEAVADSVALARRPALAQLAPVFRSDRMQAHVRRLADDGMRGRGLGSKELDAAADYIAASFKASGLLPAGDNGSYFQEFEVAKGPDGKPVMAKNVLAVLPGANPDWKRQSVVLSAHYDHLGMGWPDPKKGNENQIHNGADDNASGVAVLLELAEVLKSSAPKRNIVFAAFSAEEAALRGSRHYIKAMQQYPASQAIGNVNMDTVGRLGNGKLLVLGGASASEWKFIFMGAGFVTGVETEMVSQDISASDQVAFIEAGVPGVQLFAGASPDYHQPGDDLDKIDLAGLSKVAAIAREAVVYLAERPEPMHFAGAANAAVQAPAQAGARRVGTGITPDFAFAGVGMRVEAVAQGSPAQKAGLLPGDVIVAIDTAAVDGLRAYSDALKRYSPGATVQVSYLRGGAKARTAIVLAER